MSHHYEVRALITADLQMGRLVVATLLTTDDRALADARLAEERKRKGWPHYEKVRVVKVIHAEAKP